VDDGVLGFLGFVFIFVVLDVAALRFGVDSRRLTPEQPLPGDPVIRLPRVSGHQVRAFLSPALGGKLARRGRPLPPRPLLPIANVQRLRRPFRPRIASDVDAHPCFDLAAVGK
jgi:hypothetical protein